MTTELDRIEQAILSNLAEKALGPTRIPIKPEEDSPALRINAVARCVALATIAARLKTQTRSA